jgi:DME family drug/metabolite transporter
MSTFVSTRASRAGLVQVSAGALLWGTTGVAVQIVHDRSGLSAVTIGAYRLAIAAAFVALVSRGRLVRHGLAALRRRPLALVGCGVGFGAYQALYFAGVQYVGVSVSTLVSLGVAPVALMIGAAWARRRLPSTRSLAVVTLAITGLALVSLRPGSGAGGANPALGVLASVASGLGYALVTMVGRRLPDEDPLLLTGITSVIGFVPLAALAALSAPYVPHDKVSAWWLLYIGVVPTVAAYWLFYRGLRITEPDVAGVLTLLEPLAATALAAWVLHESLSGAALVGAALMLVAVASFYVRPSPAPPPP